MGRVFKALDPIIGRTVAIKTLTVDLEADQLADFKQRFFREAQSAGRVSHPNVVTIFDIGEADGVAFIAMEYVEGRTLARAASRPRAARGRRGLPDRRGGGGTRSRPRTSTASSTAT